MPWPATTFRVKTSESSASAQASPPSRSARKPGRAVSRNGLLCGRSTLLRGHSPRTPSAYLLAGKNNVIRIDAPESDNQIELDDVCRSLRELPLVARSLVEGSGHRIETMFLQDRVDPFV